MSKTDKLVIGLFLIGAVLLAFDCMTIAGVIVILLAVGILVDMYVAMMREVYYEEAQEEAERMAEERFNEMINNTEYRVWWHSYVGLGKGFDEHD
jgi:predicted membrane protein